MPIREFTFDDAAEPEASGFNDMLMPRQTAADEPEVADAAQADNEAIEDGLVTPEEPQGQEPEAPQEAAPVEPNTAQADISPPNEAQPTQPAQQQQPALDPQVRLMLAEQQAKIEYLTGLVNQQPGSQPETQAAQPPPPETQLTEEDVLADPVGAIRREVDARIARMRQEQAETQQKEKQTQAQADNLRTQQERSWAALEQSMPIFRDPSVQQIWANVFHNPNNDYLNDPAGPIRAANQVATMLQGITGAGGRPGVGNGNPPPPAAPADIPSVEAKAAEAERTRQARVAKSAMHGSGRGGNRQKVSSLTPQHIQLAKEFGVAPEAVEQVIKGREGGQ